MLNNENMDHDPGSGSRIGQRHREAYDHDLNFQLKFQITILNKSGLPESMHGVRIAIMILNCKIGSRSTLLKKMAEGLHYFRIAILICIVKSGLRFGEGKFLKNTFKKHGTSQIRHVMAKLILKNINKHVINKIINL